LNPHALRHWILSPARLPFRHSRAERNILKFRPCLKATSSQAESVVSGGLTIVRNRPVWMLVEMILSNLKIGGALERARLSVDKARRYSRYRAIYRKFRSQTMIPEQIYLRNLELCESARHVQGCVVECGVWRGGMSGGIADLLGQEREYFLFDSFEGLPPPEMIDGSDLIECIRDKTPDYHDNCIASQQEAERSMQMSAAKRYRIVRGWFDKTIPTFMAPNPIAILRLDGDLYDSTTTCLTHLYGQVAQGGIVILDDYDYWEGCARATHDFLAEFSRNLLHTPRLRQWANTVTYMVNSPYGPRGIVS
jgi:O-methyltransferase